jgi:hypothetical protein
LVTMEARETTPEARSNRETVSYSLKNQSCSLWRFSGRSLDSISNGGTR